MILLDFRERRTSAAIPTIYFIKNIQARNDIFEPNDRLILDRNTECFLASNHSHRDVQEHVKTYLGQDSIIFCIPISKDMNKKIVA